MVGCTFRKSAESLLPRWGEKKNIKRLEQSRGWSSEKNVRCVEKLIRVPPCMKKITRVILLNVNITNSRENQNIFCSCVANNGDVKEDRSRKERDTARKYKKKWKRV